MKSLRKALVAVASAAMVLGMMGVAGASSSPTVISRGQWMKDFETAIGTKLVTSAPSAGCQFSDVSTSNPYYTYIETGCAYGWVDGMGHGLFDPSAPLTRAQVTKIEALAAGHGADAISYMRSSTSFTDDSAIPEWARGYVVEGVKLGLVKGYPNGSFQPQGELSTADEPYFISQYKAVVSGSQTTLSISTSKTDVAVGEEATLSSNTSGTTYSVSPSGAIISGSTFIASAPGTYTVTGTANGQTATLTIDVYGAATGLKINAPSSIVANWQSQKTITVDVVDGNGNIVAGNSDSVSLASSDYNVVGVDNGRGAPEASGNSMTVKAVNGVATFTLDAGFIAGSTATLTANDPSITNYTGATDMVNTTAQVATSLSVSAPKYISANSATTDSNGVTVAVDDQTGKPMIAGTYGVNLSLAGPAQFTDGTTGPEHGAYVGGYVSGSTADFGDVTPNAAAFSFSSIQAESGAITFTASATGLTSGTATTSAVIAGAAQAIQVTPASGTSFAQGSSGITYDVQVVDSKGFPASYNGTLDVKVTDGAGHDLTSQYTTANTVTIANGTGRLTVADSATNAADAGTYSVEVYDPTGTLSSSASQTFTETANTAYQLAISGPAFVPASNPVASYTVKAEDQYGNPEGAGIAISNVAVTSGTAANVTFSATSGETNADGQFSFTATALPYTGSAGTYIITVTGPTGGAALHTNTVSTTLEVESTVATQLSLSTSQTTYTAGQTATIGVTAKDQYGSTIGTNDAFTVSYSGASVGNASTTSDNLSSGTGSVSVVTSGVGTVTVTVTDVSAPGEPHASVTLDVTAGSLAGWDLFDANGNDVSVNGIAVSANTPVELYLKPVDANHNPTVSPSAATLDLTATSGAFRLTASGSDVTEVSVPAGTSAYPVWYVNSTAGTYNPTASAAIATTVSGVSGAGTVSPSTNYTITGTVKDQNGNPYTGTIYVEVSTVGSGHTGPAPSTWKAVIVTNGSFSFTYTSGSSSNSSGSTTSDALTFSATSGGSSIGTYTTGTY